MNAQLSQAAIKVTNLVKRRETKLLKSFLAISGINLEIAEGVTYGLVGPNGAGKTTTIKLLLGLLKPDGGEIKVLGKPAGEHEALRRIGFLPESPYFYSHLTGREYLTFTGQLFGMQGPALQNRIGELLHLVSMENKAEERTGTYSKGMLQRLGMAAALVNDPDLLFLDEPMSGLDPLGRMDMRKIIIALKEKGKTIFFNSHLLPDVAHLCDKVGVLSQGKLTAEDDLLSITPERNATVLEEYFLSHIEA
ncbi:MAG: ABC transporter ATP-binding protein [Candidatus Melainabacteria bacterium]|jgi:ABC-2 type transport system ATP-binding protein|nr:ABC transporter ATP-binding protein [Candidatus Melainabacteria bacterium]